MASYTPTTHLTDQDREAGLKYLFYDGICRAARGGVTFAKDNITKFSGERRNKNNGSDKDEDRST
jgi:hypothetical protein